MFKRLNHKINIEDYSLLDQQTQYGHTVDGEFRGIVYYNVQAGTDLYQLIPEQYRADFYVSAFRINDVIPPHTDTYDRTTINVYVETGDYVTEFYKPKHNNPSKRQIDNQVDGYIFNDKDLLLAGMFKAKKNDAYVLDVSCIHSVRPYYKNLDRTAINLSTHVHDFDSVCSMLQQTGYL
jgi:hypothetical protein